MWGQGPEVCFPSRLRQVGSFLVPARKSRKPWRPENVEWGRSFGFYQIIVFPGHRLAGARTFVVEVFSTAYWPNSDCQCGDCGEILLGPAQEGDLAWRFDVSRGFSLVP